MIHLSWQMWTCFGKRKVEMCNYGGKLSRQDPGPYSLLRSQNRELGIMTYWECSIMNLAVIER